MDSSRDFDRLFAQLTGNRPFPWQRELYRRFLRHQFPEHCDIPTGLGKTSVIAIWLLALAHQAVAGEPALRFPRRLVYVVNRRTVVDQATHETEGLRRALATAPDLKPVAEALQRLASTPTAEPFAISTLRGQFADNGEWKLDPARPAVVIGTVDMVGSRLLFSGYGCGFRSRPLHAGFLAQDVLLVHDEAHLEPAFQALLDAVTEEQRRCREFRPFHVVALTATSRGNGNGFQLTKADLDDTVVRRRIEARKGLAIVDVPRDADLVPAIVERLLTYKDSGRAILVFLRRLEHVGSVCSVLRRANAPVQMLTGTLRGLERDALAREDPVFARFLREASVVPQSGTVYLVCTSAGEVGVNISADHLVCDLTPFDSIAQRFGRVNRFGAGDAQIDVIQGPIPADPSAFDQASDRTRQLLKTLPVRDDGRYDASPSGLSALPVAERLAAFTPAPETLPATDILFDDWALTSIRGPLPGRPQVADWLHGLADWEPPQTQVAWRQELDLLDASSLHNGNEPEELLADYPLKPHELLKDRSDRVLKHLRQLAVTHASASVWLVEDDAVISMTLGELAAGEPEAIQDRVVVLPPSVGGLRAADSGRSAGILDGAADYDEALQGVYDVADLWIGTEGQRLRCRLWATERPPAGMRLVRAVSLVPESDTDDGDGAEARPRVWCCYVQPRAADEPGSRMAARPQILADHLQAAEAAARTLVEKLSLTSPEADAVVAAAACHNLGKGRAVWQRSIGNSDYPAQVLAKSSGRMRPAELSRYRHELGSLLDALALPSFVSLPEDVRDLALHLIAAHHGRARPHFPQDETFDSERPEEAARALAAEVPRRFGRLQRRYGRWGLAFLESLVRAADALASDPDIATRPAGQFTVLS